MNKINYLFKTIIILAISISITCSGDDSIDGTNGIDGVIGVPRADGANGKDAAERNTNVNTYIYDLSTFTGVDYFTSIPEITNDVINNDVILTYLSVNINDETVLSIQVPGKNPFLDFEIQKAMLPSDDFAQGVNNFALFFRDSDGMGFNIKAGVANELKLIIIASNSTTNMSGKTSLNKETVLSKLKAAGVNTYNYEEVTAYYNL